MAPSSSAFGAVPRPGWQAWPSRLASAGGRRQRAGTAGCAAFAGRRAGARWGWVLLAQALWLLPSYAAENRTPQPVVQKARAGTQCIAAPDVMRRDHPSMLEHQRDETVHGGIRGAKASLKGCIDCHASPATGSVAKAGTDFCVSCHSYAAVRIDCFECHTPKAGATAKAGRP